MVTYVVWKWGSPIALTEHYVDDVFENPDPVQTVALVVPASQIVSQTFA